VIGGAIVKRVFILVIVLLALSGCRYRLHVGEVSQYDDMIPIPGYAHDLLGGIEEIYDYEDSPAEENLTEYIPMTYIEAEADSFSPHMMEVIEEDARQYASEEGDADDIDVGVEAYYNGESNIITITNPGESTDEEQSVLGNDGGVVGIIADYSSILRQGVNTLFPCQLLNIYTEMSEDFVTVGRGSDIYQLMVNAGGINVSGRLTPDRLTVSADWVVRRNPDVIVKFVDSTILGSSVINTTPAMYMRVALISRDGWGSVEAVVNDSVILFSEQMMESDETRLAVKLLVSRLMYPELFADMDVDGVVAELVGGFGGVYFL